MKENKEKKKDNQHPSNYSLHAKSWSLEYTKEVLTLNDIYKSLFPKEITINLNTFSPLLQN